eukprot:SM000007S21004  [mRNA]  locus=s7:1330876:1332524:- [translate_table: standard]
MRHQWAALAAQPGAADEPLPAALAHNTSTRGAGAVMRNWLFRTDRLARLRMTYFQGGEMQAFNSLAYPDTRYDMPLLGVDLIILGGKRVLCAMDFHPLYDDPVYMDKHTSALASVHSRFSELYGQKSAKFFDGDKFFSPHMIFYRSIKGTADPVLQVQGGSLFEAFKMYIDTYLRQLNEACPVESERHNMAKQQMAYNQYMARRDPAVQVFSSLFGKEWAERLTREFLFPGGELSRLDK